MIIRIIACWSILQATDAASARCLTGYMTDVQSWVDEEGALTPTIEWSNAIDVSLEPNAVTSLQYKMMMFRSGPQRYIQYLAMAKCKLNRVPSIFKLSDSEGRPLEQTVQYMTLYGNTFVDESLPGQEYDVMLNATKSTMITNDTVFALSGTAIWSTGLRKSKFPKLIELDLRACSIQVLDSQAFRGMPNLEALYLGENNIVFIDGNAFVGLRKLVHLDLSRNQALDETTEYTIVFGSIRAFRNMPNLKSLDLSNTKLQQSNLQALTYLGRSMQRLSLCYTGLSKLGESIFNSTSMKYLDLSGNPGILAENSNPLHAVADTLQVLYAESIMAKSLAPFKPLTKVQILKIGKNEIATIEEGDLSNFTSLQILDMDKNRITAWRSPLFSKIPQLSFLSLRENNINVIYDTMINDFENLSYLALSGNFIICNCYTRELFEVAARNQRNYQRTLIDDVNNVTLNVHKAVNYHIGYEEYNNMIVQRTNITRRPCNVESACDDQDYALEVNGSYVIVDYDDRLYQCLLVEEGKSVYFSEIYTCNQRMLLYDTAIDETWHKLVALIVLPIVLFPLLGFAFMYRKNFRYWLLSMKNIAILSLIEKKGNSNGEAIFHYDIFVSYCNEDRAWVMDNLLPHLETDCNISVCLHERDFQVGLSILENIVSCMDRSRAIMLILSKRFLLSQWCQFEMHLAQHRLLETRREDLILVLLEDIPRRVRPTTLHYLMLTKTYIVWPKGEEEQTIFWRRMKKCVVTQKLIQTENHSLA